VDIIDKEKTGHRERLRLRFLKREAGSLTDEALLELLLTYAIPQRDVRPLAVSLVSRFGSLQQVLGADFDALCSVSGIKSNAAVLLKLVHQLRQESTTSESVEKPNEPSVHEGPPAAPESELRPLITQTAGRRPRRLLPRRGTELFGKAALRQAIELLPSLPDTESLDVVRNYLRQNLHFSAQGTRERYAAYIARRLFPDGVADQSLGLFGKANPGTPELKEVCFYRFCKAEPLMQRVITDLLLPALGLGRVRRERIKDYLQAKFPESKGVDDCTQAIVDALVAGGIAAADRKRLTFSARPVRPTSFAFVLHSEFPQPGMYEVAKAESNPLLGCLLWTPAQILTGLYELRNLGLISKVSEIDSVRQFTLKFDLPGVVNEMLKGGKIG